MSVLFDLPDDLCRIILADWLAVDSLALLDSATCSKSLRIPFQLLLSQVTASNEGKGLKFLEWVSMRQMKLSELTVGGIEAFTAWKPLLTSQWPNLKILKVYYEKLPNFTLCLNSCSSLLSLASYESNIDFSSLEGRVLSQLTRLSIFKSCDHVTVLGAIREHCRQLKQLSYECTPSIANKVFLVDIFRLNVQLQSVELCLDNELLSALVRICGHSLVSVKATGSLDFGTFDFLLRRCPLIDHIVIRFDAFIHFENIGFHCEYTKSLHRLELRDNFTVLSNWNRFLPHLHNLKHIQYSRAMADDRILLDLVALCHESVESLDIYGEEFDSYTLELALRHCSTGLRTLSLNVSDGLEWNQVLTESHRIEKLTVGGNNIDFQYILDTCRYLTRFSTVDAILDCHEMHPFIEAIKQYRHCVTGAPLKLDGEFWGNDDILKLIYDGDAFSGELWDAYKALSDRFEDATRDKDQSDEIIIELRAQLEEALVSMEKMKKVIADNGLSNDNGETA